MVTDFLTVSLSCAVGEKGRGGGGRGGCLCLIRSSRTIRSQHTEKRRRHSAKEALAVVGDEHGRDGHTQTHTRKKKCLHTNLSSNPLSTHTHTVHIFNAKHIFQSFIYLLVYIFWWFYSIHLYSLTPRSMWSSLAPGCFHSFCVQLSLCVCVL